MEKKLNYAEQNFEKQINFVEICSSIFLIKIFILISFNKIVFNNFICKRQQKNVSS